MNCPYCNGNSRVVDSRPLIDSIRRRRECESCRRRFTTYEKTAPAEIRVSKRGSRPPEEFRTDKLVACLERVCRGCQIPRNAIAQLTRSIEAEVVDQGKGQLRSIDIARIVALRLSELSELASHRFVINYIQENGTSSLDPRTEEVRISEEEARTQYLLFDPEEVPDG